MTKKNEATCRTVVAILAAAACRTRRQRQVRRRRPHRCRRIGTHGGNSHGHSQTSRTVAEVSHQSTCYLLKT